MELKTPLVGLCETCIDPGHCCRAIRIPVLWPADMSREEVRKHVRAGTSPPSGNPDNPVVGEPLPTFDPIRRASYHAKKQEGPPEAVTWRFSCSALDSASGRCGIYENRPQICRNFEAGSNPLCVHYEGPWRDWIQTYDKFEEKVTLAVEDIAKIAANKIE